MNLKRKYVDFFKSKGHSQIAAASIVPENDPTCLFTTAGMHPLVPYLLGAKHPMGTKLVDYQRCVRLTDIEEVGDKTHHTFFEMLGNWSLGEYFKKEAIEWSFEFLTKELGISVDRLAVTVYAGDDKVSQDDVSAKIWEEVGISKERIVFLSDNWWGPAGETGPCGPDTEMFYWSDNCKEAPEKFNPEDETWVEIWNDVFMEFEKTKEGNLIPLKQKNVDTGMGVERVTAVLSGVDDNYKTEIFKPIIEKIEDLSGKKYDDEECTKPMRIIADHIRAVVMMLGDKRGIRPSNTDQGYIVRRLIRRMTRYAKVIGIDINTDFEQDLVDIAINQLKDFYSDIDENTKIIKDVLKEEKNKFAKTLENGIKEFEKVVDKMQKNGENKMSGDNAFRLYDTFGFPIELTKELAVERKIDVDEEGFKERFNHHQELSRHGAEQKFKGGLADNSEKTAKLHTATHLLLAGLRKYLGDDVYQRGSNITAERLRFDFSYPQKMTPEQLKDVEDFVNDAINKKIPVVCEEMTLDEAKERGALGIFNDKYNETVKVYTIGDISKEICGGPHANNTGDLVKFKIKKEESSSSGVRRIKAIIED